VKRKLVVYGLTITSSWGNGHATTYRGLLREFAARGHEVVFVERDAPWYRDNRDLPNPDFCRTVLYESLDELKELDELSDADFAMVGSYVPQGCEVGDWVLSNARCPVAFYDIDTPVTLAKLARGDYEYIEPSLIPRYAAYLSFTGGPTLARLEREFGSPAARALFCSFDPDLYYPEERERTYDLAYMGTYSDDRQPPLERLMLDAARAWPEGRFLVAGPQFPPHIEWPQNVERVVHLAPKDHRTFYNSQRFTMNITRADMVAAGWSPSVRLFEAAACGVPIISDAWEGLGDLFEVGKEILVARSFEDTLKFLREFSEDERVAVGEAARRRVLAAHTAAHRAAELEAYMEEAIAARPLAGAG
jgi:spore maturation protein CgeB